MVVRVSIDRDYCISSGICWTICPEFFEPNPTDEFSQVIEKYRIGGNIAEGEAPHELEDLVREAADSCPGQIIHIK